MPPRALFESVASGHVFDGKAERMERKPDLEGEGDGGGNDEQKRQHKPDGGKRSRVEAEVGAEDVRRHKQPGASAREGDGEH